MRSEPLINGERARDSVPPLGRATLLAMGVLAWAFALPGWFVGARLTLDGVLGLVNAMASLFGIALALAVPPGAPLLLATLTAGIVYSLAEMRAPPLRRTGQRWQVMPLFAVVTYLLTLATDYGTTAYGLLFSDLAAWPEWLQPLFVWARSDALYVSAATLVISHYPEILLLGGAMALRRAMHIERKPRMRYR